MTLVLPPQAGPWWAIIVLAVLGAAVGAWLSRALADAGYRRPDERDRSLPRYTMWLVVAVALTWASLTFRIGGQVHWSLLPAYLYLGAIGAALTLIDLDVHRLPDLIVLPSYPIAFVLLLVPTVVSGDWGALLRGVLAGLALFVGLSRAGARLARGWRTGLRGRQARRRPGSAAGLGGLGPCDRLRPGCLRHWWLHRPGHAPCAARDPFVIHRLWPVDDPGRVGRVDISGRVDHWLTGHGSAL